VKFRTMLFDDGEDPEKKKLNRITAFGAFLRKTQFDEVPQFWNILKGDISLIGPRPEIPRFVEAYRKDIPFYEMRHLIQPGLSGWAQIKHASPPKFKLDVEATRNKLSYDLYYLKYRSFFLDLEIILRTIKILLARASQ
jgi:lipopolysaccharide/colanic/teichoic acid biosynthesis glycosyltransferase